MVDRKSLKFRIMSTAEISEEDANNAFSDALGDAPIYSEQDVLKSIDEISQESKAKKMQFLVTWIDSLNTSLLWYAARSGYSEVVNLLLESGADVAKARRPKGIKFSFNHLRKIANVPLMAALAYAHYETALTLLNYYSLNRVEISPLLAGRALLVLSTNRSDEDDLRENFVKYSIVHRIIELVGEHLNHEIKVEYFGPKLTLLCHAAGALCQANLVKILLEQECITNHSNALHEAVRYGNVNIVKLFFEEGSIARNKIDCSALSHAAVLTCEVETNYDIPILQILLNHGASFRYRTVYGESAVSNVTCRSDVELLEFILDNGGNPLDGLSALDENDPAKSCECLSLILDSLVDEKKKSGNSWINKKIDGMPVLTLVAMRCSEVFVRVALEKNADIEMVDDLKGRTPLHWACSEDNRSAVHALLEAGADPNARNNTDRFTCLHTAVSYGSVELVQLLLQYNVNPNLKTMDKGFTALHFAVACGRIDIVKMLLNIANIDVDAVDNNHTTPLADAVVLACSEGNNDFTNIVGLLLNEDADPDIPDLRGNTALITAAGGQNIELIRMLVNADANLEARNDDRCSPLSLVAEKLHDSVNMEIVKVMLNRGLPHQDNNKLAIFLTNKAEQLLQEGKVHIIAALAVLMLQSTETRRVITDSPGLWGEYELSRHNRVKFIPEDLEYPYKMSRPGNMLTWAILNDSPAVQILLESVDNDVNLPFNWRSSLVIEGTEVGTPIRCAINRRSISAVSTMLNVLKSTWNFKYLSKSKQRNDHPLDNLQYQDIAYVAETYPELMVNLFKEVQLVPSYSFVSGLHRAPLSRNQIWVLSSYERSPTAIWSQYLKYMYGVIGTHGDTVEKKLARDLSSRESTFSRIREVLATVRQFIHTLIPRHEQGPDNREYLLTDTLTDRVMLAVKSSYVEKDVKAYVVPVKCIAAYPILLACVHASDKLEDPILFSSPIMVAVLELHWTLYGLRRHNINLSLFLVLLIVFIVLIYYFKDWTERDSLTKIFGWCLQCVKLSLSLYFLCWQERKQMMHEYQVNTLWAYFSSVWNLVDLSVYGLIFAGFILQVIYGYSIVADGIHSIVALLLWFKLLDFVRPFRSFGPMVNLFFRVTVDIRGFLVILLIVMLGFGNAFSIILDNRGPLFNCDEANPFLQALCEDSFETPGGFETPYRSVRSAFSYMLGTFDFEDLDNGPLPVLLSIVWALFMFAVAIILFNLLIAIISESYERISATKLSSWRLEQARVAVDIFAMLTAKEQQEVHDYILRNPWLQVLIPEGSVEFSSKEDVLADEEKSAKGLEQFVSTSKRLEAIEKAISSMTIEMQILAKHSGSDANQ